MRLWEGTPNSEHLAEGREISAIWKGKGRKHVGRDSGFALISTVTFQKAGTPNSNKSFPEYFWRHRGGAGLCGWVWLFLVCGIIFSYG